MPRNSRTSRRRSSSATAASRAGGQRSHQASWERSVYEVYQAASIDLDWAPELQATCLQWDRLLHLAVRFRRRRRPSQYMPAIKIGSGDITWIEFVDRIASKGKPVLLATGASDLGDVQRAVGAIRRHNPSAHSMQCNTNYTGSIDNFATSTSTCSRPTPPSRRTWSLACRTTLPASRPCSGRWRLARAIEKHFTDDVRREGPDHGFSMNPVSWREMVDRTRELELRSARPKSPSPRMNPRPWSSSGAACEQAATSPPANRYHAS